MSTPSPPPLASHTPARAGRRLRRVLLTAAALATLAPTPALRAEPPLPPRPIVVGQPERLLGDEPGGAEVRAVPDAVLRRATDTYRARRHGRPLAMHTPRAGALSGRVIAVSPGHGLHFTDGGWHFQRDVTNEIREDLHTNQLVIDALDEMLERAGAEVVHTRERSYGTWSAVIDNDAPASGYSEVGAWQTGGSEGYGGTYRFASLDPSGAAEAVWSFEVPDDSVYPVYVYFLASGNRADVAGYAVVHATGESERWLRQSETLIESATPPSYPNTPPRSDAARAPADLWHLLGFFPFRAGEHYEVRLSSAGDADRVVIADAVRVGAGMGEVEGGDGTTSGRPRWEEAADTFLAWLGVPTWLQVNDVVIRPLYAAYRGVDAYVAVHTNAISGSASGTSTWTWYPEMWVPESSWPADFVETDLPPGTYELADAIHTEVVGRLRANWDPEWRDGGHWGADFGELRPLRYGWTNDVAQGVAEPMVIPAALMEVAYHSEPYDARLLAEMGFREDVARGYLAGLVHFFAGDEAVLPPLAPVGVRARATDDGLEVTWEDAQDPLAPDAVADRYLVYLSGDGLLFDDVPVEVDERRTVLSLTGCEPLYVRVTAVNEGGESLDSAVVGGARPRAGGARILIVDGVDRERKVAADPNNPRTWARVYGPAALAALPGAGFDIALDEVAGEALDAAAYDLVIWATGETSERDDSLSVADQPVVEALREAGTPLLVSGAELAWELARGDSVEQDFLTGALEVSYVADDAETTELEASGLGDLGTVTFGDCSADAICVEWPDVLAPAAGGDVVLTYATGGGAAVRSEDGTVIAAGFPLESVADPTERRALIALLAGELLDLGLASDGACPGGAVVEPEPEPAPDAGADAGDMGAGDAVEGDGAAGDPGVTVHTDSGCACGVAGGGAPPWWIVLLAVAGLRAGLRPRALKPDACDPLSVSET